MLLEEYLMVFLDVEGIPFIGLLAASDEAKHCYIVHETMEESFEY